jgi:O-antigen biosynthesis protein WbqP
MLIIRNLIILVALLPIFSFLFLLLLIIIIEDGMPAIFIQERVGFQKKIFHLFKLRTMKKNTLQAGTHDVDQSQVLKCGKIIRKFKLDEFLQLINVLKGDINLVGPRPSLENQKELVLERENRGVFSIKPGITGLSQVCGYDMSDPKKLAYVDSIYLKHQSFVLDLQILVSTFTGIFKKDLKTKFNI